MTPQETSIAMLQITVKDLKKEIEYLLAQLDKKDNIIYDLKDQLNILRDDH